MAVACRQDVLGQFTMVSMELFNIVEDINKVNKGFMVHPKNVNAENASSTCSSEIFPFSIMEYMSYRFCSLWLV
jgi:hypothetical protein